MARNKNVELTAAQVETAQWAKDVISERMRKLDSVTIEFTRRNGTLATITGPIIAIVGNGSTQAVTLGCESGFRSANLWAVQAIR